MDKKTNTAKRKNGSRSETLKLPLLPVRDIVIFPYMVIPLIVGRQSSIAAVEKALATDSSIMLSCQRLASVEEPLIDDIYQVGTISKVLRIIRLPDGKVKVLIQGVSRAKIKKHSPHRLTL